MWIFLRIVSKTHQDLKRVCVFPKAKNLNWPHYGFHKLLKHKCKEQKPDINMTSM